VRRYGGKDGKLSFNEFALAVTKVVSLIGTYLGLAAPARRSLSACQEERLSVLLCDVLCATLVHNECEQFLNFMFS